MAISNPTPKQVRNGANTGAPGSGATVAKPGPDASGAIAAAKGTAEAAAMRRASVRYTNTPDVTSTVQAWDAGLAINDVEGGGSG